MQHFRMTYRKVTGEVQTYTIEQPAQPIVRRDGKFVGFRTKRVDLDAWRAFFFAGVLKLEPITEEEAVNK